MKQTFVFSLNAFGQYPSPFSELVPPVGLKVQLVQEAEPEAPASLRQQPHSSSQPHSAHREFFPVWQRLFCQSRYCAAFVLVIMDPVRILDYNQKNIIMILKTRNGIDYLEWDDPMVETVYLQAQSVHNRHRQIPSKQTGRRLCLIFRKLPFLDKGTATCATKKRKPVFPAAIPQYFAVWFRESIKKAINKKKIISFWRS